jgi:hypothetical protein
MFTSSVLGNLSLRELGFLSGRELGRNLFTGWEN